MSLLDPHTEAARFILDEALRLDIRVGTNGDELVILAPMRIPTAIRRSFEDAVENYRAEIIAHIRANGTPCGCNYCRALRGFPNSPAKG